MLAAAKKPAATNARRFRTFLLMQQFDSRAIGSRIAQARREAGGMLQEELAELLDVSKRSVQDYEAGVRIPWKHFQQLEVIFKRSLEWFLHGDEAAEPSPSEPSSGNQAAMISQLARIEAALEALVAQLEQDDPESRFGAAS